MKKIISIILAAAMLLSMSLCLLSCGDKDKGGDGDQPQTEKKVTYTVTVVDEDGNPVSGVMVEFAPKGGESFPVKTKSEGKASTTTTKELSAKIIAVPDEYEYDNIGTALTFDANGKVTVTLKKAEVARLTIRVIDNEGNPIKGVEVQMCSTVCKTPVVTDENGEAFYIYEEGFKAQLTMTIPEDATPDEIKAIVEQTLPEGYTVDDPTAKYEFIDGVATIVLTKKVTYTVTVVDEDGNPVSGVMVEFAPKGGESFPIMTKSDGKASTITSKELSAKIIAVPDEYEYDNIGTVLTFDASGKVTVTLKKAEVALVTIRVIDNEGNPIEGVTVQMCSTVCKMPVVTDENGEAFYSYEEGFKAQLTKTAPLPNGYTVDNVEAKYEFIDGVATIVLTKVN